MIPIKKKLRRDAEKTKIVSCRNCHKQHKWGVHGDYCNMTCYYAELTRTKQEVNHISDKNNYIP